MLFRSQEAVLDMGCTRTLEAFTFLPRQGEIPSGSLDSGGTPDQYEFYLSTDANQWNLAAKGTLNNPQGMQVIALEKPIAGRYLRFVATHVVNNGDYVAVAGLGAIEEKHL